MKCPVCWAEKAYSRKVPGWKGWALACLLLEPMKCHHCYHKFVVPWFATWGKPIQPPPRGPGVARTAHVRPHRPDLTRSQVDRS